MSDRLFGAGMVVFAITLYAALLYWERRHPRPNPDDQPGDTYVPDDWTDEPIYRDLGRRYPAVVAWLETRGDPVPDHVPEDWK